MPERRSGRTKLSGRPLDEHGSIQFHHSMGLEVESPEGSRVLVIDVNWLRKLVEDWRQEGDEPSEIAAGLREAARQLAAVYATHQRYVD